MTGKKVSFIEVLAVVIIVLLTAVLIALLKLPGRMASHNQSPVNSTANSTSQVKPVTQDSRAQTCSSNLHMIGNAIKMYLSDWDDTYPSNRVHNGTTLSEVVQLSDPNLKDAYGQIRYQYGYNWVEALKPYTEKVAENYAEHVWKCPSAKEERVGSPNASVTYALNGYLAEKSEGIIKNAGSLMLIRELDRLHDSVLRPSPTMAPNAQPRCAFLSGQPEPGIGNPNKTLHQDGSHILFADGHVSLFADSYFPTSCEWDLNYQQWFNYATKANARNNVTHLIAVTP